MSYTKRLKTNIFTFAEQLLHSLIISGCVVLVVALLIAHFFNFAICVVLSDSMQPEIQKNDIVLIKKHTEYKTGDILQFFDEKTGLNITHRLVGIKFENEQKFYICCGDNVTFTSVYFEKTVWENNAHFVENLNLKTLKNMEELQIVQVENVKGKVVDVLRFVGKMICFIKSNFIWLTICVIALECSITNLLYLYKEKYFYKN